MTANHYFMLAMLTNGRILALVHLEETRNRSANWQRLVGEYALNDTQQECLMKSHSSNIPNFQDHPCKKLNERCKWTLKSAMRNSQMQIAWVFVHLGENRLRRSPAIECIKNRHMEGIDQRSGRSCACSPRYGVLEPRDNPSRATQEPIAGAISKTLVGFSVSLVPARGAPPLTKHAHLGFCPSVHGERLQRK